MRVYRLSAFSPDDIQNGELNDNSVIKDYLITAADGNNNFDGHHDVFGYNLAASRLVSSIHGIHFQQTLKGFGDNLTSDALADLNKIQTFLENKKTWDLVTLKRKYYQLLVNASKTLGHGLNHPASSDQAINHHLTRYTKDINLLKTLPSLTTFALR